jgi:hypothetical protein
MKIVEQPYSREQLEALSRGGKDRVAGVVAVPWHELLGREQDSFEEEAARRVTGSRCGLADVGIKLAGCLGQDVLLEVSGDVSLLLEQYDEMIAAEAAAEVGERLHGVDVGRVVALAKRQILEAGLYLQAGSFSELHDFCDANMLGFGEDGEHLADGTAYGDLSVERGVDVMNRVQGIIDAWLRSGEARRQGGGNHAS